MFYYAQVLINTDTLENTFVYCPRGRTYSTQTVLRPWLSVYILTNVFFATDKPLQTRTDNKIYITRTLAVMPDTV